MPPAPKSTSPQGKVQASEEEEDPAFGNGAIKRQKRAASLFDTVAGRVGFNGFLTKSQLRSNITALGPEDVLLRRVNAPMKVPHDFYNADERLSPEQKLPDSDLLEAVHSYVSNFYTANTPAETQYDFRSFDETALLAFGILLEEAARETLGENGDMVLVEPEELGNGLPESSMVKHQVRGRVKPPPTPEYASVAEEDSSDDAPEDEARGAKRRRRNLHEYTTR